ncbi:family 20 glycosylhydrolase [Planctomycetota bacterium]
MNPTLLPRPSTFKIGAGRTPLSKLLVPPEADGYPVAWDIGRLCTTLKDAAGKAPGKARAGAVNLQLDCTSADEQNEFTTSSEKYRLVIEPEVVRISAEAPGGLRMGLRTLAQAVAQAADGYLPCMTIEDEPDLAFRAMHLDMKAVAYSMEYWRSVFDELAEAKLNAVMLEYEDKFPFSKKLGVAGEEAYSVRDIRHMLAMLAERGIKAIPLQQCFGHFNYVLKHHRYAGLREDHRAVNSLCATNPESAKLVRELLDEVADLHRDAPYFHLGGDEVNMGCCSACAAKVKKSSVSKLYMDSVEPLCAHIAAKGHQPMMWADMFLRYYEDNRRMAGKVTLVDWNYGVTQESRTAYFWRTYQDWTPEQFAAFNEYPKHRREFEKFFPKSGDEPFDALYTSRYLQRIGYDVIGASAVSTGSNLWIRNLNQGVRNTMYHADSAKRKGMSGILCTRWAECSTCWETTRPGVWAAGAFAWRTDMTFDEFKRDFSRACFGVGDDALMSAVFEVGLLTPVTGGAEFCKKGYDGECGERDVSAEWRAKLSRNSPSPDYWLETADTYGKAAMALNKVAKAYVKKAVRNQLSAKYFLLASEALLLRTEQDRLVLKTIMGGHGSAAAWRKLMRRQRLLRSEAQRLLKGTVTRKSMERLLSIWFEGEATLPDVCSETRLYELMGM